MIVLLITGGTHYKTSVLEVGFHPSISCSVTSGVTTRLKRATYTENCAFKKWGMGSFVNTFIAL